MSQPTLPPLPSNTVGIPTLPPFNATPASLPTSLPTSLPASMVTMGPMTGAPTGAPTKLGDKQRMGMSTVEKITIAVAIAVCIVLAGLILAMTSRQPY